VKLLGVLEYDATDEEVVKNKFQAFVLGEGRDLDYYTKIFFAE
jgi:hypothetical protein